jgi:DNA polymerase III subunit gamma/tau
MAYEITATRKRPQSFEDLAGQDFVSATLKASIASGRIAHAYLFSGPRGCGKTSTARILARSLNCEQGPSAEPCGRCDSCLSIARGSALDVIEIDGASNTSVENVRQIKDEVLFPPNSSKYKIYIIDEVHMLSNSAFNALLKTIEEPPPYIVFIFATTELHKVPATIKSRCQQFNFRLIDLDTIKARLASAAADLGVKADDDALLWMAREATGSLRDAYTLFDQVASFSEGYISAAKIREKLGLVGSERLGSLMEHCVSGDRASALQLLDAIIASGVSVEQFAQDAVGYARSLLLIACGIEREALLGMPRAAFPDSVVAALDAPKLERMLAGLFELYRNMRYSVNPRWELELAIARLCAIKDYIAPAELAKTLSGLKSAISGAPSPATQALASGLKAALGGGISLGRTQAEEPAAALQESAARGEGSAIQEASADNDIFIDQDEPDLAALKHSIVSALGKTRLVLSTSLERSAPWFLEGATLVIPCANGYDASTVLADSSLVAKRVAEIVGRSLKVEARAAEQTGSREVAARPSADADDAGDGEDERRDPVEIVERVFRGRRVEGTGPARDRQERD